MSPMTALDGRAIGTGALAAAAVCLPAALLGQTVADAGGEDGTGRSPLVVVSFVGVLLGFVLGGYVAGRMAPRAPYSNAAFAALGAFAAIQVVSVALRASRGDDIAVVTILFNVLIAYACGLAGGLIASRRRVRPRKTEPT